MTKEQQFKKIKKWRRNGFGLLSAADSIFLVDLVKEAIELAADWHGIACGTEEDVKKIWNQLERA